MADNKGLKLIGWALGTVTAAVMFIAAVVVHDAVADSSMHHPHSAVVGTHD